MSTVRLLNGNVLEGIIEGYQLLEWTRPYLEPGTFRLEIPAILAADQGVQIGRLIEPPGEPGLVYLIEQLERNRDEQEHVTASGRDFGGYLMERDCVPPAGLMHDTLTNVAAETAMKHYVNVNAGPGAVAARMIPKLTVAADLGRPAAATTTYQARYQYVGEILGEIGGVASLGWEVRLDYASGNYVFDVIPGVNRATLPGGDRVYFDPEFDTARAQQWVTGNLGRKNVARVLGPGEGAARTVVVTWLGKAAGAPEPTGVGRRELVVDARDLTTTADLERRGQAKLQESLAVDSFAIEVGQFGSFRYQADWNLGDLVVIRNRAWGIEQSGRIISVKGTVTPATGAAPRIEIEVGRPAPSLADILRGGTLGNGSSLS